jgi:hypothetical protein
MNLVKSLLMGSALLAGVGMWTGCEKEGGGNHNVGNDCLVCHKAGGGGDGVFTAGGTVYKAGTTTGAAGATIKLYSTPEGTGTPVATMTSEVSGNFHSQSPINFGAGLYAKITSSTGSSSMMAPVTSGACNSCHGATQEKITVQ